MLLLSRKFPADPVYAPWQEADRSTHPRSPRKIRATRNIWWTVDPSTFRIARNFQDLLVIPISLMLGDRQGEGEGFALATLRARDAVRERAYGQAWYDAW
jgi:hypothetical protein